MASVALVFIFVLAVVVISPRAARLATETVAQRIQQLLEGVAANASKLAASIAGLLRGVASSLPPLAMLGGVLVACAAVPTARSEFEVTRRSLQLVWTDEIAPDRIALSLVLMTCAVGLLMHVFRGMALRCGVACAAVSLTLMPATLAYYRTIELEKVQMATETLSFAAPPDGGALAIGSQAAPVDTVPPAPEHVPHADVLPAFLAALLAFLLSLGGIIVSFGAFSLGGPVLLALLGIPFLALAWGVWGAARIAGIATACLAAAIPEFIDACVRGWVALIRFIKTLLPSTWTSEADGWRRERDSREAQFAQELRDRHWASELMQAERRTELGRRNSYHEFAEREQERDQRSISDALEASRQRVTEAHMEGMRELLDILAAQRREFFSAAVQEVFRNLRSQAAKAPLQLVSMLFWPLDRVWRMVGDFSPTAPQTHTSGSGTTAPNSPEEES